MSSGPQGHGTTTPFSISCCCEGRIMTVPSNLVGSQPKCLEIIKAFDLLIIIYCFYDKSFLVVSVQLPSHVRLFVSLWTAAHQVSLSITNSRSLLRFMSIESVCHPAISSSVVPFSSHLQSFPASGSFPMSQLFTSGGQSIGVSSSVSVLPKNIQD